MRKFGFNRRWVLLVGTVLVSVVALLPWWRNHAYVRHFFDYSVVIAGAARIDEGERPYVDFATPNQSGAFLFDLAAEKLGGGTFQAMTLGAGVFIVVSVLLMARVLSRRWPPLPSLAIAGAVVCAGVSQHTVIWYNSIGVVCLALVTWGAAVAPVLRGTDYRWHAMVGAALFVGGITKLNFQVLALAIASAWALRAVLQHRTSWARLGATLIFLFVGGVVLPVGAELAWTGATPALWWHNTVGMAAPERAGALLGALKPGFYLRPMHDYYGPLLLPQVGLVGLWLSFWAAGAVCRDGRRRRERLDCWIALPAGLLAAAGGAALLATNYEIAYVGWAAWLALAAGLWLGFSVPARGVVFYVGLVLPALLGATASWVSAWQGQRSQFGYSGAPRDAYRLGSSVGSEFAYLKGTFLPPEECNSLETLRAWHGSHRKGKGVLYGAGLEWLERIWPVAKAKRLPLANRWGSTCGPEESTLLADALRPGGTINTVLVSVPQDLWRGESQAVLARSYTRSVLQGGQIACYRIAVSRQMQQEPLEFLRDFGGNVDSHLLNSWMDPCEDGNGRRFFGITHGDGALTMEAPCYRAESEAVVHRLASGSNQAVSAHFWVIAKMPDGAELGRWDKTVELPSGQTEVVVPSGEIDGSGLPLMFSVSIDDAFADQIVAGWRAPTLTHTVGGSSDPPRLQGTTSPEIQVNPAILAALFPGPWRPERIVIRGGQLSDAGVELPPGGEVWAKVRGSLAEYAGWVAGAPGRGAGPYPFVRVVWYKGGRIQIESQAAVGGADQRVHFKAWSAEPDGWFGVLAGKDRAEAAPVIVRVTKVAPGN